VYTNLSEKVRFKQVVGNNVFHFLVDRVKNIVSQPGSCCPCEHGTKRSLETGIDIIGVGTINAVLQGAAFVTPTRYRMRTAALAATLHPQVA
jgi:hypothetical protein